MTQPLAELSHTRTGVGISVMVMVLTSRIHAIDMALPVRMT